MHDAAGKLAKELDLFRLRRLSARLRKPLRLVLKLFAEQDQRRSLLGKLSRKLVRSGVGPQKLMRLGENLNDGPAFVAHRRHCQVPPGRHAVRGGAINREHCGLAALRPRKARSDLRSALPGPERTPRLAADRVDGTDLHRLQACRVHQRDVAIEVDHSDGVARRTQQRFGQVACGGSLPGGKAGSKIPSMRHNKTLSGPRRPPPPIITSAMQNYATKLSLKIAFSFIRGLRGQSLRYG